MACDEFYADRKMGSFLAKRLSRLTIAERSMTGSGLCSPPSAIGRMADTGINLPANERLNYREWNAPTKKSKRGVVEEHVVAYLIGESSRISVQNIYVPKLESMAQRDNRPDVKAKYSNTIRFLKHFGG